MEIIVKQSRAVPSESGEALNRMYRPVEKILEDGRTVIADQEIPKDDPFFDSDYRSFLPEKVISNGFTTPVRPYTGSLDSQDQIFDSLESVMSDKNVQSALNPEHHE